MPGLAIGMDELFHKRMFCNVRNAGGNQLAGLHLMNMAVLQRFFSVGQFGKQLFTDDVLHPHELRVLAIAIVNHALDYFFIQVGAIVVSLHLNLRVAIVEMESIQVGIECIDGWA